ATRLRWKRVRAEVGLASLWECVCFRAPVLPAAVREGRPPQAQHKSGDGGGDYWEIKYRMLALDPDIARQASQPLRRKPAPHYQSDERRNYTDDHDEFPQVAHDSKSCANCPNAQA